MARPVRHALPYPRRGSRMTRAPILAAISGVPSFELLSTTMTSVMRSGGKSSSTRPIACASLCVGMMTETRMRRGLGGLGEGFSKSKGKPLLWRTITTKTRTATVGRAMRRRPISGLRLRSRAQGIRVPKPAVPISTMYPTPKSKGCPETEKPLTRPDA